MFGEPIITATLECSPEELEELDVMVTFCRETLGTTSSRDEIAKEIKRQITYTAKMQAFSNTLQEGEEEITLPVPVKEIEIKKKKGGNEEEDEPLID